jgi:hypothetical protein
MATEFTQPIPEYGAAPVATTGPISSLYSSKGMGVYRYPSDLGHNNGLNNKNHYVTFTIYDVQSASIGAAPSQINQATMQTKTSGVGTAVAVGGISTLGSLINGDSLGQSAAKGLGAGLAAGIAVNYLNTGLAIEPPLSDAKSSISLYMPDTLNVNYDSSYDEMSLTSDLGSVVTTLRAIDAAGEGNFNSTIGNLKSQGETGGNNIGTDPNTIQAVVGAMEMAGLGNVGGLNVQNLGTLLQRAGGYALNPQLQMIYRGTGLRTFQLTFTFTPKNQSEAQTANDIINQFRFYSSPSLANGTVSTNSMFLIPPSVFTVQFYVNGNESQVLPRYGKCVLTSIDVNHTPSGFATYSDGSMVQTQVNLSFKELDILTRDKFNTGERR